MYNKSYKELWNMIISMEILIKSLRLRSELQQEQIKMLQKQNAELQQVKRLDVPIFKCEECGSHLDTDGETHDCVDYRPSGYHENYMSGIL